MLLAFHYQHRNSASLHQMKFSWLKYFKGVIGMDDVNINVDKDTVVIVKDPDYYKKLFPLIDKYPKRTLANYIIWRLMKNRAYNLPKRFMDAITEYNKELYGISVNRARWRECSSYVKAKMGLAAGRLFIEKAFDEVAKKDVGIFTRTAALFFNFVYHKRFRTAESNVMVEMIINIQDAFKDLITDLDWMSETTKNVAKEKLINGRTRMHMHIHSSIAMCLTLLFTLKSIGWSKTGRIELPEDESEHYSVFCSQLTRRMEALNGQLPADKYFENVLEVLHHQIANDLKKLNNPVDRE
ncbi:hypothetical protein KUTeg_001842 [Tegillarca granosa]|uniref:Peptidase M13 N-terminal domain-containing protein n=1 Tax=Tegillarca granosa TaxID=220873 RepID=A0ABQ9FSN9_TEGGR|nr:hypothetical protein KUTeg_001842 [Tegillarca granosa]